MMRLLYGEGRLRKRLQEIPGHENGNFGILTAIAMPVLLGAAGMAVDLTNAYQAKAHLGAISDAAALAASSALAEKKITTSQQAKDLASSFVKGQLAMAGLDSSKFSTSIDISIATPSGQPTQYAVNVVVSGGLETSFMRIFGRSKIDLANTATATSAAAVQNSLSMYLVLDRSGSMQASVTTSVRPSLTCTYYYMNQAQTVMYSKANYSPCYYYRIEVLQDAVAGLLDTLAKADPDNKFIRTGAAAYSSSMFPPEDLDWGTAAVGSYVAGMTANGGTSSTQAFKEGVNSLVDAREDSAHKNKNGLTPKKFILLMTDGENNDKGDNTATLKDCTRAKNAGITVYTVGFMLSSATAKSFLASCASSASTYYDAQDGALLIAAFKAIASQTSGALPRLTN